jgi:hypothetical protein
MTGERIWRRRSHLATRKGKEDGISKQEYKIMCGANKIHFSDEEESC